MGGGKETIEDTTLSIGRYVHARARTGIRNLRIHALARSGIIFVTNKTFSFGILILAARVNRESNAHRNPPNIQRFYFPS